MELGIREWITDNFLFFVVDTVKTTRVSAKNAKFCGVYITVEDKLKQMHVLTARMPGNH